MRFRAPKETLTRGVARTPFRLDGTATLAVRGKLAFLRLLSLCQSISAYVHHPSASTCRHLSPLWGLTRSSPISTASC